MMNDMSEIKKKSFLAYAMCLMKDVVCNEQDIEKTKSKLKEIGIIINTNENIVYNELLDTYCKNMNNILKDSYFLTSDYNMKDYMVKIPKFYHYMDHFGYWREACFAKQESPCQNARGLCLFEQEVEKLLVGTNIQKFRLRKFFVSDKCIYCYFKNIAKVFYINMLFFDDDTTNTEDTLSFVQLNKNVQYFVDLEHEYPSSYMLCQYENPNFLGVIGAIPHPQIEQLQFFNHVIHQPQRNRTVKFRGVIHKFYKKIIDKKK